MSGGGKINHRVCGGVGDGVKTGSGGLISTRAVVESLLMIEPPLSASSPSRESKISLSSALLRLWRSARVRSMMASIGTTALAL